MVGNHGIRRPVALFKMAVIRVRAADRIRNPTRRSPDPLERMPRRHSRRRGGTSSQPIAPGFDFRAPRGTFSSKSGIVGNFNKLAKSRGVALTNTNGHSIQPCDGRREACRLAGTTADKLPSLGNVTADERKMASLDALKQRSDFLHSSSKRSPDTGDARTARRRRRRNHPDRRNPLEASTCSLSNTADSG